MLQHVQGLDPIAVGSTGVIELPPLPVAPESPGARVRVMLVKADEDGQNPLRTLLAESGVAASGDLLDPPYDMNKLAELLDISSGLRPNIDAYVTNIDASGFRFEPAINLSAPDANERVHAAM